jgi:hypothetical protein
MILMRFIPSVLSALLRQKNIREFAVALNELKRYDHLLSVSTRKFVSKFNTPVRISEGREHTGLTTAIRKHDFAILSSLSNRAFVLALVLSVTLTTCFPRGDLLFLIRKQKILVYANAVNARNKSMFVTKCHYLHNVNQSVHSIYCLYDCLSLTNGNKYILKQVTKLHTKSGTT